jgi:hypothetical protein
MYINITNSSPSPVNDRPTSRLHPPDHHISLPPFSNLGPGTMHHIKLHLQQQNLDNIYYFIHADIITAITTSIIITTINLHGCASALGFS